jgi:hypothetical protein
MESKLAKFIFAIPLGFLAKMLPLLPLILVGLSFIMVDVYTAWRLSVRLKRDGKRAGQKMASGKFKSVNARRVIDTMIKMMLVILLAHMLEVHVLNMLDVLYLANWVTAVFCIVQALSILENISSEGDSKWARLLQGILINKAERHYDIDLSELKQKTESDERTDIEQERTDN